MPPYDVFALTLGCDITNSEHKAAALVSHQSFSCEQDIEAVLTQDNQLIVSMHINENCPGLSRRSLFLKQVPDLNLPIYPLTKSRRFQTLLSPFTYHAPSTKCISKTSHLHWPPPSCTVYPHHHLHRLIRLSFGMETKMWSPHSTEPALPPNTPTSLQHQVSYVVTISIAVAKVSAMISAASPETVQKLCATLFPRTFTKPAQSK